MTPICPHIGATAERLPLQRGAGATPVRAMPTASSCSSSWRAGGMVCRLPRSPWSSSMPHWSWTSWPHWRPNEATAPAPECPPGRDQIVHALSGIPHPSPARADPTGLGHPGQEDDQPLIHHLSVTEMQAILNVPDLRTRSGIRDRAMLHVCFAAGLRVSELLTLPVTALSWQPTPTIQIQGKGRRHRALPLWKQTAEDVRAWLAVRGEATVPELFIAPTAGP